MEKFIITNIKKKKFEFLNIELIITHNNKMYFPIVQDEITWSTERKGVPGKLTFKVFKDKNLKVGMGDPIRFKYGDNKIFFGFIFTKSENKDNTISITAYDQLRYLKNKDSYIYTNKTASNVIQTIVNDFNLNAGEIADTKYKIAKKSENNKTLFDIILNALDDTMLNTNELYVLYDDFSKLTLKNIRDMKADILIDDETVQDYEYNVTIDNEVYNQIKLIFENSETKQRSIYMTKSTENINKWGVLQYYGTLNEGENGKSKADSLLKFYNKEAKTLKIKGAFGEPSIRAGTLLVFNFNFSDTKLLSYMLCEKVTHHFKDGEHTMDLTVIGGDFIS